MTSQRKADANRRNAGRSTGPRTDGGKASSSLNAIKFGPVDDGFLLPGESAAAFAGFAQRLRADLAPRGAMELLLVDRVIKAGWCLQRLDRFEVALFAEQGNHPAHAFWEASRDTMAAVFRREVGLQRSLERMHDRLQRMQAIRRAALAQQRQPVDAISAEAGDEPSEWLRFSRLSAGAKVRQSTQNEVYSIEKARIRLRRAVSGLKPEAEDLGDFEADHD